MPAWKKLLHTSVDGGDWTSGGTDLAIANGGTGASSASAARTNLGVAIGSDVQAYDSRLDSVVAGTYAGDDHITTVGTICTGTWNGAVIADAYLSSNTAHLSGTQTFTGSKTFSSTIQGSISGSSTSCSGNAATVTNGVYNTGNQTIAGTKTFSSTITHSGGGVGLSTNSTSSIGAIIKGGGNGSDLLQCKDTSGTIKFVVSVGGNTKVVGGLGVGTTAPTTAGEIRATNEVTAYYGSDIAMKKNITPIANPLDKVMALGGYDFKWKAKVLKDRGGEDDYFVREKDVGIIAQEVEKVCPEIVATRQDGNKAVRYEKLVPLLIESIKELTAKVTRLENGNSK